jgi:hypothetical protein
MLVRMPLTNAEDSPANLAERSSVFENVPNTAMEAYPCNSSRQISIAKPAPSFCLTWSDHPPYLTDIGLSDPG